MPLVWEQMCYTEVRLDGSREEHGPPGKGFFNELAVGNGSQMWRAKVPGGWFVRMGAPNTHFPVSTLFYPDPSHQWDGNSLP